MQTLEEFLRAPFGVPETKQNDFERKYQSLVQKKRIWINGYTKQDDMYLLHLKVGSDSSASVFYDVVILFFTDNKKAMMDLTFRNYYVKFFSNSPSFIYQYATLYKENGMLIDMLWDKLDPTNRDKRPDKANPTYKLSYDKSIYSACRFLQDHRVSGFSKAGVMAKKKYSPDAFFASISGFEDIKLDQELAKLDKKIDKEMEKAKSSDKKPKKDLVHNTVTTKKQITTKKAKRQTGTKKAKGTKKPRKS